jgi:hypothetical protein
MLIDFLLRPFSEWHDWRCDVGGGKTKKILQLEDLKRKKRGSNRARVK